MNKLRTYCMLLLLACSLYAGAQVDTASQAAGIRIPPMPTLRDIMKDWGPRDTIIKQVVWYGPDYDSFKILPVTVEENVWVSKLPPARLEKVKAEWSRLRNAVYVCYPYARVAGTTINEITKEMEKAGGRSDRKSIIKSKEKELKKQFSDPLSNLSVYQGKVLMKLINRQTGNNCYDIIKEYRGGLNARIYQTVAFFYGSSLKQSYDLKDNFDHQIELFVKEIDGNWYNNPYRTAN